MTLDQTIAPPMRRSWDWRTFAQRIGPLVALIILVAFTAWRSDRFLTPENIFNILRQNAPVGILALGMTFVIIVSGIDLSVGSLLALAGGVGIWSMNTLMRANDILHPDDQTAQEFLNCSSFRLWLANLFTNHGLAGNPSWAIGLAIAATLIVGMLGGLINGLLISAGRLTPFIATLGTMAAFRSITVAMVQAGQFTSSVPTFNAIGGGGIPIPWVEVRKGTPLLIGYPVVVFFALTLVLWIVLRKTRYGRYAIAVGCNEKAAIYSAIRVGSIKLWTYTMMGLLVGIAALLQASRFNSLSSSSTGLFNELDAIAAVAIGGTSMRGGFGTILGTLVGVLLMGVLGNMLIMLNIDSHLQGLVKGAIVIAAALIQRSRNTE